MKRVVLILPGLSGSGESIVRDAPPSLREIGDRSSMGRLLPAEPSPTPETAYFGLPPESLVLEAGPLMVSALGADPPERSVHFHLSLLSLDDQGVILAPPRGAPIEDVGPLLAESARLNTSSLAIVAGTRLDHGLVWEDGSIDLGCSPASLAVGRPIEACLPQGDGERILRRFIFDSVDLLSRCEVNLRRQDQGLAPLNLLWPWGAGFRGRTPNLALRRGEPAWYSSNSMRMVGLARLLGERHDPLDVYGQGLQIRFDEIASRVAERPLSIVVVDAFARLRERSRFDEAAWLLRRLDEELIAPLVRAADRMQPLRLAVASPDDQFGISLCFESFAPQSNAVPFDERAAEEARLPRRALWEFVDSSMRSDWPPSPSP